MGETGEGKTAYIFPGQGAQSVGMGQDIYDAYPQARQVFDDADCILGYSLSGLCFQGPLETLMQTVHAQPAILTTSLAYLAAASDALDQHPKWSPSFVAGHSLGEYSALVAAGALDLSGALRLVQQRGRLMQEAGERSGGGMGAVLGLDDITLEEVCQETGTEIANVNSDEQIVISGSREALARALDLAMARGAKRVIPLRVAGAFHSSLMKPVVEGMRTALEHARLRRPAVLVIGNRTGQPLADVEAIKEELLAQICGSVLWRQSVRYMAKNGVRTFLEIGPGRVLTGLVRQIETESKTINLGAATAFAQLAP